MQVHTDLKTQKVSLRLPAIFLLVSLYINIAFCVLNTMVCLPSIFY